MYCKYVCTVYIQLVYNHYCLLKNISRPSGRCRNNQLVKLIRLQKIGFVPDPGVCQTGQVKTTLFFVYFFLVLHPEHDSTPANLE